jgi:hypothetical protein
VAREFSCQVADRCWAIGQKGVNPHGEVVMDVVRLRHEQNVNRRVVVEVGAVRLPASGGPKRRLILRLANDGHTSVA